MSLILSASAFNFVLQQLEVPKAFPFAANVDFTSGGTQTCSATLKARTSLDATPVIATLVSPTDITGLGASGIYIVTFSGAHWTALFAAGPCVFDMFITPSDGSAPRCALAGTITAVQSVSRP